MTDRWRDTFLIPALVAAACAVRATDAAASPPSPAEVSLERLTPGAEARSGDAVAGAALANTCRGCHALEPGDKSRYGPDLQGIVGRVQGAEAGYRYGAYLAAQQAAGATWDDDALRDWLTDSKAVARAADARTKMPPQRLTEDQIDDLILYLRTLE